MSRSGVEGVVHIVDDDDLVCKSLARLMRACALTPRVYGSAELFLKEIRSQQSACVLLDMTMPRMTGLQVQAQLKARGISIPVIALSARDDEETCQRARALNACCFLRKPVDDEVLLDAIRGVMGSQRGAPLSYSPAVPETA